MKNKLFIVFFSVCFLSCGKTNIYEFSVENQLNDKTIKIVPTSTTNFWITSSDNFTVVPNERVIVGSKIVDGKKKAKDIYKPDDIIVPFDVYIDDIKQEKRFSQRKYWDFSIGKVDVSGKYILTINENSLND
jgi:hypothetical protein